MKKLLFVFVFLTYFPVFLLKFWAGELVGWIPHPTNSPAWNLSKTTVRYVENTNKKSSFLLWQICQFNHYGWLILLKFYWFLNSNSQNLLLAHFLIRPILDPKFPLMFISIKRVHAIIRKSPYMLLSHMLLTPQTSY